MVWCSLDRFVGRALVCPPHDLCELSLDYSSVGLEGAMDPSSEASRWRARVVWL